MIAQGSVLALGDGRHSNARGCMDTRLDRAASARGGYPVSCVSVASKGFSVCVSLLFATFTGRSISVAVKGVRGHGTLGIPQPHVLVTI
jgi:hypothetical protein